MKLQRGVPALAISRGGAVESALLAFPVALLYQVGVAFVPGVNGVDVWSRPLLRLVGGSVDNYLVSMAGLLVAYLAMLLWVGRCGLGLRVRLGGVVAEALVYALTMGSVIVLILEQIFGRAALSIATGGSSVSVLVVQAAGAGVCEELVFRVLWIGGGLAIARRFRWPQVPALVGLVVSSSVVFALAHHVGSSGDPWSTAAFAYRALAGLALALIFRYRSFAHAVYTHFFYDVYVMVLHM